MSASGGRTGRRTDPWLKRFTIGIGVGVVLGVMAFLALGWGHGVATAECFNTPFAGGLPGLIVSPIAWAIYFAVLPEVRPRWVRVVLLLGVFLFHMSVGMTQARRDWNTVHGFSGVHPEIDLFAAFTAGAWLPLVLRAALKDRPGYHPRRA